MTPRPRRTGYAASTLALDLLALGAVFAWAPLDWELAETTQVALPLTCTALLGAFLAGGYRLSFPIRRSLAATAALGLTAGLAVGWLLLKLLSQKAGLRDLTPPALEGSTLATAALATFAFLQRRLLLGRALALEADAPIALVTTGPEPLLAHLRARGINAPLTPLAPADLAVTPLEPLRALVLAIPPTDLDRATLEHLAQARGLGLPVLTRARFEEELLGYTPLGTSDDPTLLLDEALEPRRALYLGGKRLLDVVLALLLGLALLLPTVLAALAVRLTTSGPALFRQTRAGLHRRPFTLYKLRTMVDGAEATSGPTWAEPDDPRVTRVGRFLRKSRLDEVPQLWNVLRGDMSLVGPRPERPELDATLAPAIPFYALRHLVRPGLTGWAQVRLGYGGSEEAAFAKLEHDVYYLKHASFAFDLQILARTVPVVLGLRGR